MNYASGVGLIGPPSTGTINPQDILRFIYQQKQADRDQQANLMNMQTNARLKEIAAQSQAQPQQQQQPQNVVLGRDPGQMTKYEGAEIATKQAQLAQEVSLKKQQLAQEKDIAGAKLTEQQKKEQDIHETKQKELQAKVDKANKDLAQREAESARKEGDFQAQLNLHKAQLDAANAQHELDNNRRDAALAETKRQHDMEKANWDRRSQDYEKRISDMAAQAKANAEAKAKVEAEKAKPTEQVKTKGGFYIPGIGQIGGEKTVTTTQKVTPDQTTTSQQQQTPQDTDKQKAIDYLQKNNKPITDSNIKFLLDNKGKW